MNSIASPSMPATSGVVVIGRNEGERLRRCLASVVGQCRVCVYVDSGSTDGSPELARGMGAQVVDLDMRRPFTAARARNEGFARLLALAGDVELVQFVDGDCEIADGWLAQAGAFLAAHPEVVAVCGRRRERSPQASIYNQLCDIEWNTPVGEARAFGGDVLLRAAALSAVGGYRAGLIAGEEPELCVRLRAAGGRIWRLDADMTWHDAAITRLGQWWRRNLRSGHAFAEGASLHGQPPERHFVKEVRRALAWGVALPVLAVLAAAWCPVLAGLLLAAFPLQVARLAWRFSRQGRPVPWRQAFFLVLGRFPEAQGVIKFWWGRWRRRGSSIIEYK